MRLGSPQTHPPYFTGDAPSATLWTWVAVAPSSPVRYGAPKRGWPSRCLIVVCSTTLYIGWYLFHRSTFIISALNWLSGGVNLPKILWPFVVLDNVLLHVYMFNLKVVNSVANLQNCWMIGQQWIESIIGYSSLAE